MAASYWEAQQDIDVDNGNQFDDEPRMILCAHADRNGEGAHWKREGEPCLAQIEPNLARCDWYQGCGTCTFGCWEEPACETDGPWPDPNFSPAEANTITIRRYAWRMQNWLGWQRTVRLLTSQSGAQA